MLGQAEQFQSMRVVVLAVGVAKDTAKVSRIVRVVKVCIGFDYLWDLRIGINMFGCG